MLRQVEVQKVYWRIAFVKEKGRKLYWTGGVVRLPCRTDKATGILMLSTTLSYTLLSLAEDGHGRER